MKEINWSSWVLSATILVAYLSITISIHANYQKMDRIEEDMTTINSIYEEFDESMSKVQMYNETLRKIARNKGRYVSNDLIIIHVKDQDPDEIYETFCHEVAHHDIRCAKGRIKTEDYIAMDYNHFCNLEKQTNWNLWQASLK